MQSEAYTTYSDTHTVYTRYTKDIAMAYAELPLTPMEELEELTYELTEIEGIGDYGADILEDAYTEAITKLKKELGLPEVEIVHTEHYEGFQEEYKRFA